MDSRLSYMMAGKSYQGFQPLRANTALRATDRIAIVQDLQPDVYFVDCEGGVGELRRFIREYYQEYQPTVIMLRQDLPTWVVATESTIIDSSRQETTISGPFYSQADACAFAQAERTDLGTICAEVNQLQKP